MAAGPRREDGLTSSPLLVAPRRARATLGRWPLPVTDHKEVDMKYLVSWTYRLNGSAKENEESLRRGLAVFARWQPPAGVTYHQFLGRYDGSGGFAVVEGDNVADLAEGPGKFGFIADYQIYPVADIAEAVQALKDGVEFRDSIS